MRQRADGIADYNAAVIRDFMKLGDRPRALEDSGQAGAGRAPAVSYLRADSDPLLFTAFL
jgi:hypothetical protein